MPDDVNHRTLLLNATYEPLRVISWQRAITLWFEKKVEIVEEYADILRSPSTTVRFPAVVRLVQYVSMRKSRDRIKFGRHNVFARDAYTCQYCGCEHGPTKLTYDHVIPRSRGGKTNWDNIVTSCYPCNAKKADRTPAEAGMKLRSKPARPEASLKVNARYFRPSEAPDVWAPYLIGSP